MSQSVESDPDSDDSEGVSSSDKNVKILPPKGLEWWQASLSMVLVVIGGGLLALPDLEKEIGWIAACTLVCAIAVMTLEAGMSLWRAFTLENTRRDAEKQLVSYDDLARAAFGKPGEVALTVPIVCLCVGLASVFSVLLARSIADITEHRIGETTALLAISPVLACLALVPDVSTIAKASPLGVFAICTVCVIIVVKSLIDATSRQGWSEKDQKGLHVAWKLSLERLSPSLATLLGAFGVVPNLPSIMCEMKEPADFPKAFRLALLMIVVIYIAVMNSAYYAYGTFMQKDITQSLVKQPSGPEEAFTIAYSKWTGKTTPYLNEVVNGLLTVKLVIVIPLMLVVVFQSLQTYKCTRKLMIPGSKRSKVVRISVVAVAVLIGLAVPDFAELLSLVAAMFVPFLCLIYPVVFHFRVSKSYNDAPEQPMLRMLLHVVMILIALYVFIVGTYQSVKDVTS